MRLIVSALAASGLLALTPAAAHAKPVCGWYAIAFCSPDRAATSKFLNKGWGALVETQKYQGLKPGLWCAASGPQPRASALRDQAAAISNGVSASAYIKQACTDSTNIGD